MDPKMFSNKKCALSSFDNSIFISVEAKQQYGAIMRGYQNSSQQVIQIIVNLDWELLCEELHVTMVNVVREFFVNGKEAVDNRCYMRDFKFDEYTPFSLAPINHDELLRVLSEPQSGVVWKKRDDKILIFLHQNVSKVTKYWALLNYTIMFSYTIDVGKLIHSTLNYIIKGTTSMGLGHLSLIYALC
ncbi:hypothetical protein IEQ34_003636 [Dendrobium chrysotoxum]|uniref:Uncharacterized protein n=1 Tax=Dendrobium chrysotoxum TaxID=161865 RepID=A0AAV7HM73_DENCH|nr:hypothetical protein IEQ34_003636 [Dendrobium chrysotoxum]